MRALDDDANHRGVWVPQPSQGKPGQFPFKPKHSDAPLPFGVVHFSFATRTPGASFKGFRTHSFARRMVMLAMVSRRWVRGRGLLALAFQRDRIWLAAVPKGASEADSSGLRFVLAFDGAHHIFQTGYRPLTVLESGQALQWWLPYFSNNYDQAS